jgi:hypothetical protein
MQLKIRYQSAFQSAVTEAPDAVYTIRAQALASNDGFTSVVPEALYERTISDLAAQWWAMQNRAPQEDGNAALCAALDRSWNRWKLRDLMDGKIVFQ